MDASKRTVRASLRLQVVVLGLVAALLASGAEASELKRDGSGIVVEVIDGDTVLLKDGRQVRLVGIQAPKLPLGRANFTKWPLADEAKGALEGLALGRQVSLGYGGRRQDRRGRELAHLFAEDGSWLQGALLQQGLARVYSFRDNRARIVEMLVLERQARTARRGIWRVPYYRVLTATETPKFIDTFQLVEGTVLDVAVVRGRLYINFGADWRQDFTVTFAARDRALLDRSGFDYRALKDRRIRVRGWLKRWNGPMIEATHPEQIEVLQE